MRRNLSLSVATLLIAFLTRATAAQEPGAGAVIEAAKRGGVVIACRHGLSERFDENEMTLVYDDPATQRKLSAEGERQSRAMGEAFRALGIRPAEVIASPMQRARRMAELMFDRVTLDSSWHTRGTNYGGAKSDRRRAVLSAPVRDGNRVIISHIGTLNAAVGPPDLGLDEGDCAVIRPDGTRFGVIGTVRWREWLEAAGVPKP